MDVAGAVVFLASSAASLITGETILIVDRQVSKDSSSLAGHPRVTTLPVVAARLEPLIALAAASPSHVWGRCQSPALGSYDAAYSGVCRVSRQLCTDSLFDP
jgi:hypothetical protein